MYIQKLKQLLPCFHTFFCITTFICMSWSFALVLSIFNAFPLCIVASKELEKKLSLKGDKKANV